MGKNHQYSENSGFIRLDGENIIDGQIDINSARLAIEGTQEVFEYFLKREDSQLQKADTVNFSIITRQGCWEILIPFGTYVAGLATTALATGINSYAKKYGDKLAELHLESKSKKNAFADAFSKLDSIIKIAQHLGVVDKKETLNTKIINHTTKTILLTNNQGNVMSTNLDEINCYLDCPDRLLRKLASVVTDYRTLSIGFISKGKTIERVIDIDSKEVFSPEDELQEPILPELNDGEYVKIEGYVSRGNQITNTIGFKYKEHVITCEPINNLITHYLNSHYRTCEISGRVIRTSKAEVLLGKRDRPKIMFDNLIVIDTKEMPNQTSFFTQNF